MEHCNCCSDELYNNIKIDGNKIENVKAPCLIVQFLAVSQNGMSIQYIVDQTLDIQLVAIHQNIHSYFYFKYDFLSVNDMEIINMALANQYHKNRVDENSIPDIFKKTIMYLKNSHIYSEEEFKFELK
jgi:hypothetical protein